MCRPQGREMQLPITRRCVAGMLLAAPFISRTATAATFPSPGGWPNGSPASVGLNVTKLTEAQRYAQRYGGAGCVIRHGKLVHSWGSLTQLYNVQSATKSFGSVLLGFAVDDGKVGLTAPAQRYLPGIGAIPTSNVAKGWLDEIRVDHLATHTAGFPKSRLPSALAARPGTKFIYSDGGTNWLAALLTKVYGQDLRTLAQSRLFTPDRGAQHRGKVVADGRAVPDAADLPVQRRHAGQRRYHGAAWLSLPQQRQLERQADRLQRLRQAVDQLLQIAHPGRPQHTTGCCGGFPVSTRCRTTAQAASTTIIPSSFPA